MPWPWPTDKSSGAIVLEGLKELMRGLTVSIGQPWGYSGSVFNVGDNALVCIDITNNTGFVLRNVVLKVSVAGSAVIDPQLSGGVALYDGEESFDELQPLDSEHVHVRIKGTSPGGDASLSGTISAEIVPYSRVPRGYSSFAVTPI
jgi:hypothetical protein